MKVTLLGLTACLFFAGTACAQAPITQATLYKTTNKGQGAWIGTVSFRDTKDGLEIETDLKGLPKGEHGFHVHEIGDCRVKAKDGTKGPAMAAGGHYDPDKTGKHLGPNGGGHKGDLPVLIVDKDGVSKTKLYVKNVKASEFRSRALMIHEGGDNYADTPKPLGGGGARIACGIIN